MATVQGWDERKRQKNEFSLGRKGEMSSVEEDIGFEKKKTSLKSGKFLLNKSPSLRQTNLSGGNQLLMREWFVYMLFYILTAAGVHRLLFSTPLPPQTQFNCPLYTKLWKISILYARATPT